ncbi:MAG TPA: hypothetical protein VGP72_31180 [Planctomycetota bacterium]|jgi:hypothetical protein
MRRKCRCLIGVWLAFAASCGKQDIPTHVGPPVAEKKEPSSAEAHDKQNLPARVAPPVAEKKEDSTGAANSMKQGEPEVLSAEQARKALLEMLDAGGLHYDAELLAILRQRLQTAKVKEDDDDTVWFGSWHCNLRARTFVLSIDGTPAFIHTYWGAFAWSNDTWRASVKRRRTFSLPH